MSKSEGSSDSIEAIAAAWLARDDLGMGAEERAEFDRWRAADPRHEAAVNAIAATWAAFDRPFASGQAESLRMQLHLLGRRDRRRRWMAVGVAITLAAACLLLVFSPGHLPVKEPAAFAGTVATARISEPERRTLPDGSIVELKPGAAITEAFRDDARIVKLTSGEAHFAVTKNPHRPFIVEADGVWVRAVGTAFAVDLGGEEVEVLVTEGKVSVASPSPRTDSATPQVAGTSAVEAEAAATPVAAGQQAIVRRGAAASVPLVATLPEAELAERLSWRVPALEFSETSIAEAAALFNRYGNIRLRAADNVVAAMRVTGMFRSDNPGGFARALGASLGLRVEYRAGEIILRHP